MIIAHLDMDAFFASLEERDNPQFKGMPIAVGSDPKNGHGRGVVSTANYKAREYGIHSALPINLAWQLSEDAKKIGKPTVVFLPPDFSRYEKSSKAIFEILKKNVDRVEPASIDEFYFDLTGAKTFEAAEKKCRKIKAEIKANQKITCSIGIGENKLIAKIAAGVKKPDGLFVVRPNDSEMFLEPLSIRKIPGIGPKTEKVLNGIGIKTVVEMKNISKDDFLNLFGKFGAYLYDKARGIDDSEIVEDRIAKSIGEQSTFYEDSLNPNFIFEQFEIALKGVFLRFSQSGFKSFKTIAIVVRFRGFETKTSAKTFKEGVKDYKKFKTEAIKLLLPFLDSRKNPKGKLIRLLGVRIEKLN